MALSKKKQKQLLEQGFKVDLDPNSKRYQPRVINPGTRGLLDRTSPPSPIVPKKPTPNTDRLDQVSSPDGQNQVPNTDRLDQAPIPLSKQQWDVWNLLRSVSDSHEIISYRIIAERLKIKPNGARRAVEAIQKERGLLKKETVRTATTQGFRIEVNPQVRFHQVDKHVTYGILKRGLSQVPSTDRLDMDPSTDMHSMYVPNIRHTNYKELLRLFPPAWKLRERTLRHIESQNPTLPPIHLKTSYLYLIGQAQSGKQKIKDHNAWLIGCFKDGAPITETDIEMLLENHYTVKQSKNPSGQTEENKRGQQSDEMEILRKYLASSDTERAEIDRLAEAKATPLLAQVGEDKHAGIWEQAKIEATREYFNL